jgi:hypothetical protein
MFERSIFRILLASLAGAVLAPAATVLVDHTFDGIANDTGGLTFQQITNGIGTSTPPQTVGSSNLSTGVITTGTGAGQQLTSSAYGFNTTSSFNVTAAAPTATGFAVTFHVAGTTATLTNLQGNGLFPGVVTGTDGSGII